MVPTWMVPPQPTASLRWPDRGWLGAPAIRRLGRRQVVGSNWQRPLQERPRKRTDAVLGGIANLMASPRNRVLRGHVEIARTALDKDRERQWQGPMIETPMVHAQAPRLPRIQAVRP